ncbi:hypothetical protein LTR36_010557 [Oleoguttula mirabilis]|uniref:J domain-containing protein n=1 Tax=Oleoguttula mirabilis TaxID=1507867 RepID=A0AAV9JS67_9PEZI|nr:hypothetical protein LTR36_010557 [Oleoguttula mirabilis]
MAETEFRRMRAEYNSSDPFAVLGLQVGCTLLDVKDAYRSHALQLHPDRPSDGLTTEQQTELFQLVGTAYDKIRAQMASEEPQTEDIVAREEDADFHSPQQVRKRVADAKARLEAARQEALHSKWAEELQSLLGEEKFAAKTAKFQEKAAARVELEARGADKRAKRIAKESRGKGRDPAKREATSAPKPSERPKRSGKERKPVRERSDWAAGLRDSVGQGKESRGPLADLTKKGVIESGLGLARRPEVERNADATSTQVSRKERFTTKESDPLEAFQAAEHNNGVRSLNAAIPTDEDWEENSYYLTPKLRVQWGAAEAAKEAKLEDELNEAAQAQAAEQAKAHERRSKRIANLKEQLKAVGQLNGKTMDPRTRKAVLSGKGNAVAALPSGQRARERTWESERHRILQEESLLTEGDWASVLVHPKDGATKSDYCVEGHTNVLAPLNVDNGSYDDLAVVGRRPALVVEGRPDGHRVQAVLECE